MNEAQFEQDFDTYIASGEFCYLAADQSGKWTVAEAISRLRNESRLRIEKFHTGLSSISVFGIAARNLAAAGFIRQIKVASEPADNSEQLIAERIAAYDRGEISTYSFRLMCKQNRALRDAFEVHTGLAALASPQARV